MAESRLMPSVFRSSSGTTSSMPPLGMIDAHPITASGDQAPCRATSDELFDAGRFIGHGKHGLRSRLHVPGHCGAACFPDKVFIKTESVHYRDGRCGTGSMERHIRFFIIQTVDPRVLEVHHAHEGERRRGIEPRNRSELASGVLGEPARHLRMSFFADGGSPRPPCHSYR